LRYQGCWAELELESRELLSLCLKKIHGLNRVKLVDAQWIWTEAHSRRLKVKATVQQEVVNRAVLQQSIVVTYVVRNQQCEDCAATYSNQSWKAQVQVRQRVPHKRTFLYLEQLVLRHGAHERALSIESFRDGMDFFFAERNQAAAFTSFLEGVCPVRVKKSKKLVSADNHSNIFHFKYTTNVEIIPLCKDDLVLLPKVLAKNLSDISRLCLVLRINNHVSLVDPVSCQQAEVSVEKWSKHEFGAALTSTALTEFVVLNSEPAEAAHNPSAPNRRRGGKYRLAEVEVARAADLGANDTRFTVLSHLGRLLRAGDAVLGYDLAAANVNAADWDRARAALPDVVLVRKVYNKKRLWELRQLEYDRAEPVTARGNKRDAEAADRETEAFLQEIEGDKEMRKQINLYKKKDAGDAMDADTKDDDEDMDEDEIRVEDLLDEMALNDADADPDKDEQVFAPEQAPAVAEGWAGFKAEDDEKPKPFGLEGTLAEEGGEPKFHFS